MTIFLIIILLLCWHGAEIASPGEIFTDYLDKERTTHIKGVFTALIILSHYVGYIKTDQVFDKIYLLFRSHLSQAVVCIFFFYSGFGIMEAIKTKGPDYIKTMPHKRILIVFKDMVMAVLLFAALQACYGNYYSIKRIVLSFIGWSSIGNSNWYINAILALYIITFISGLIFGKLKLSKYYIAAATTAGALLFVLFLKNMGRDNYCYNSLAIYAVGMWYSVFKNIINKLFSIPFIWESCMIVILLAYAFFFPKRGSWLVYYYFWMAAFTLMITLASMKVRLNSSFSYYCGSHVFSIYILQRIPMIILSRAGFLASHKYIGLVITIIATLAIAAIFDKISKKTTSLMNEAVELLLP